MLDITMCNGEHCPLKESCYRHKATPDHYQSYFVDIPLKEDGTCEHFMEIWNKEKPKRGLEG